MAEYYGWIFLEEKMPPKNEEVMIAYVEDGEVEYLISKYGERKILYTTYIEWYLPQYYKQSCVKAWRKIPPFVVEKEVE